MLTTELKNKIKNRDKRCLVCGSAYDLTIDHKIPLSEGGTNDESNLETLCVKCNSQKASVPPIWQQIKNLFNGNFYRFKNEIRARGVSLQGRLEVFKQSMENKLRDKFITIDNQLNQQNNLHKIIQGRLEGELKKSVILASRIESLESLLELKDLSLWHRIKALEDYHKIEWIETKGYKKIKRKN